MEQRTWHEEDEHFRLLLVGAIALKLPVALIHIYPEIFPTYILRPQRWRTPWRQSRNSSWHKTSTSKCPVSSGNESTGLETSMFTSMLPKFFAKPTTVLKKVVFWATLDFFNLGSSRSEVKLFCPNHDLTSRENCSNEREDNNTPSTYSHPSHLIDSSSFLSHPDQSGLCSYQFELWTWRYNKLVDTEVDTSTVSEAVKSCVEGPSQRPRIRPPSCTASNVGARVIGAEHGTWNKDSRSKARAESTWAHYPNGDADAVVTWAKKTES